MSKETVVMPTARCNKQATYISRFASFYLQQLQIQQQHPHTHTHTHIRAESERGIKYGGLFAESTTANCSANTQYAQLSCCCAALLRSKRVTTTAHSEGSMREWERAAAESKQAGRQLSEADRQSGWQRQRTRSAPIKSQRWYWALHSSFETLLRYTHRKVRQNR